MKILSIDIGITNLGYVFSEDLSVIKCNRVNITNVRHTAVKECNCKLRHDRCIPDYLDHFIQENVDMFNCSELILIERQPPVGLCNVQDILFTKFRSKVLLISPRSVHKFFKMSKDYTIRKEESERIASEYLSCFVDFSDNFRKHDIADAMLMIIYNNKNPNKIKKYTNPIDFFEQFRFTKILIT